MDIPLFTQLVSLGLSLDVVIAIIVLYWKRADDTKHKEELTTIITRMESRDNKLVMVMEATALALGSLQSTIESFGALRRLEDRLAGLEAHRGKDR